MKLLALLTGYMLISLVQGLGFSNYLRFIPKFGKVSRHDKLTWPPKFCNGLSCPKFTVLETVKDQFEVREYQSTRWVSTNVAGMDYREASSEDFGRLFKYISGNNMAKRKIPMTAPVIIRIIPGQGPACESNFTMSFFVADDDPPQPADNKVFLQTFPPFRAYVRSFGGYAMSITLWLKEASKLAEFLQNTTYTYKHNYYYTAGYNSPFQFFNRHNEIWFMA